VKKVREVQNTTETKEQNFSLFCSFSPFELLFTHHNKNTLFCVTKSSLFSLSLSLSLLNTHIYSTTHKPAAFLRVFERERERDFAWCSIYTHT